MSSVLNVTKLHPLAKRGDATVPIVLIPVGEHPLSKYPDWAVARLVEKGHATIIKGAKVAEEDPEAAEALAKAKTEAEAAKAKEDAAKAKKG